MPSHISHIENPECRLSAIKNKRVSEDLLSRIVRLGPTLHYAERRVADLVLSDMDFIIHARTIEIAARAGVSTATITRFCRTVGCKGLRELKLDLAKILAVGDRYLHPRTVLPGASEAITQIVSQLHLSIDRMVKQISDQTIKQVAKSLARAKRVVIFGGGGGSSMVAMEAENRMFRLGLQATSCNDAQLQLMMAATLKTGDALLVFSITGEYEPIIQATEIGGQYGAHTIAVTAPDSPLAHAAAATVPFSAEEPENIFTPTPARYVMLVLLDILSFEVARIRKDAAVETMRRIKYQLMHMRDRDDSKPLGD